MEFNFDITSLLPYIMILLAGGSLFFFRGNIKGKILKAVHKLKQKQGHNKLASIQTEQVGIEANLKKLKNLPVETQKKIRDEIDISAVKIQKILEEDNISVIDENADKNWNNL